jgi:hypothetical protein
MGRVNVELQCGNGRTCTIPAFVARSNLRGIAVEWRELAPAAILAMMMQALGQNSEAPARAPAPAWNRRFPMETSAPYSPFLRCKGPLVPVELVIIKSLGPPATGQACRNSAATVLPPADLTHTPQELTRPSF